MGRITITLLIAILVIGNASAQTKNESKMERAAAAIFTAWQKGEAGEGYEAFKVLIDEEGFKHFSHPLVGSFAKREGYDKLLSLIKEREAKPNKLAFSNIIRYSNGNGFCFQFDSEGTVSGNYPYKGYNIIQIEIHNGKLVSFREYFGFVDAAWFK